MSGLLGCHTMSVRFAGVKRTLGRGSSRVGGPLADQLGRTCQRKWRKGSLSNSPPLRQGRGLGGCAQTALIVSLRVDSQANCVAARRRRPHLRRIPRHRDRKTASIPNPRGSRAGPGLEVELGVHVVFFFGVDLDPASRALGDNDPVFVVDGDADRTLE